MLSMPFPPLFLYDWARFQSTYPTISTPFDSEMGLPNVPGGRPGRRRHDRSRSAPLLLCLAAAAADSHMLLLPRHVMAAGSPSLTSTPTAYVLSSFHLGSRLLQKRPLQQQKTSISSTSSVPSRLSTTSTTSTQRKSIIPDDYSGQQHERLTSAPSWRKAEQVKQPSALESALWNLPGMAWSGVSSAHAGLVNLTGSVAGGVVSGFNAVVNPVAAASATTITNTMGAAARNGRGPGGEGAGSVQSPSGTNQPHELYGDDGEELFSQEGEDDGFFAPVHAYDDSLELVVWDDATLYVPPPDVVAVEGREDDSPIMSQLQNEVAQMLGKTPPSPSPRGPKKNGNKEQMRERKAQQHAPVCADSNSLSVAHSNDEDKSYDTLHNRRSATARLLGQAAQKAAAAGYLAVQAVLMCAAALIQGPQQRALQLAHVVDVTLRAMIATLALYGAIISTFVRRAFAPKAKTLPRPDVFQRLTTTFTRFLHANYPWLLAHPIFYGRPFPWQWKGWKPQRPSSDLSRSSLSESRIQGLPTLSALLRDLGDAVTPHNLLQKKRERRAEEQQLQLDQLQPWNLPFHVKDDCSKSTLQLSHDARDWGALRPTSPPSPRLDVVTPLVDFSALVPPADAEEKDETILQKEINEALKSQGEEQQQQQRGADTAFPSFSSSSNAPSVIRHTPPSFPVATTAAININDEARSFKKTSGTNSGSSTTEQRAAPYSKGPELFTSYFPHELGEEEGAISPYLQKLHHQQQQQQQQQQQKFQQSGGAAVAATAATAAATTTITAAPESPTDSSHSDDSNDSSDDNSTILDGRNASAPPKMKASWASGKIASVFSASSRNNTTSTRPSSSHLSSFPSSPTNLDKSKSKELAQKEDEIDAIRAAQDSAYGRILADLTSTPMAITEEDVVDPPPGLNFRMPWAASVPSLEQMDKKMVVLAVESARAVQSKTQLWRYIEEIGIAPLLAAIKKSFHSTEEEAGGSSSTDGSSSSISSSSSTSSSFSPSSYPFPPGSPSFAFPSLDEATAGEKGVLRTQAVEAILHLMNVAIDLRVLRAAFEEGPGLVLVVGREVVSDLIDIVEEPLLLLMPRIIRPRNDQLLYRGQRAAVEVLFQLVLASDKAITLIQNDGRLWNALQQMTAEGMYASESPTYATCHKLLAALGHNEWRPRQPGQRGLRILSFDGGGTRGVLSVALLKQVMERVGKDVFETFDVICGTSTGGILAVLFGIEKRTINEAEELYDKLVSKIFASSPLIQTTKLLLRTSYYDEVVWEQVLQEMLGDDLMIDSMGEGPLSPKVFCASLSLKTNPASLYIWRNYAYGPDQEPKHSGSFRVMVRDALRATTAAPTFFSPLEKDDAKYCDGAFLANNPTAVALNEVRTLYPGVPVECVVSIGTGVHVDKRKSDGGYGWEGIVNDLINCATNTEVTHETLSVFLPKSKYYRFNPQTEFFPLDETKPERLARMKRIAREYFWQSENKERMNQLVQLLKKGGSPLPHLRSSLRP